MPTTVPGRAATAVDAPACGLGESPRWAHDAWWWVNATAGTVWTAGAALTSPEGDGGAGSATRAVLRTGDRVSLVQPATDGRLVVARGTDLLVVDPRTGASTPWGRVELPRGWVLNDGIADDAGRLWIGSVHPGRLRGSGRLHVVDRDGSVTQVADGLTLSNGMAWRSATILVHADSLERCLWEHEVEPASATVLRTTRAARLASGSDPHALALPDGIAIDAHGGLWVAVYGAGEVRRLVHGRVTDVVEVPTSQVTSVALGGRDGRDLLITTAQEDLTAADLAADQWAGRVFRARAEVPGVTTLLAAPDIGPVVPE